MFSKKLFFFSMLDAKGREKIWCYFYVDFPLHGAARSERCMPEGEEHLVKSFNGFISIRAVSSTFQVDVICQAGSGKSAFCVSVRATPQAVRAKLVSILCSENILDKAFLSLKTIA